MNKLLLLLLATSSSISLMGMTMDEGNCRNLMLPLSCCTRSAAITPIQHESGTDNIMLQLPKKHCWSCQQYEEFNANDIETYTQTQFAELIKTQHDQQASYHLARITTTIAQKPVIHYLDAAESQKAQDNLNPINRTPIEKTDCFEIKSNDPRRAIHTFTVLSALSQMNNPASEERSATLSQQQSASSPATRCFCCSRPSCSEKCIVTNRRFCCSCPSCNEECIGTICCCVIYPPIMVSGSIIADIALCLCTPCLVGCYSYCNGTSYKDTCKDSLEILGIYTKDACKSSLDICQMCYELK